MIGLLDAVLAGLRSALRTLAPRPRVASIDERTLRDIGMTRRDVELALRGPRLLGAD